MKRLVLNLLLFFNLNICTLDFAQWEKELAELDIIEQEPAYSHFKSKSSPDAILVSLGSSCRAAIEI